jgi:hypothetical protein
MTIKFHTWELGVFVLIGSISIIIFWFTFSHVALLAPLCLLGLSVGTRFHQAAIREASGIRFKRPSKVTISTTTVLLPQLQEIEVGTSPGFIYVMKRSDGIYKLGRSGNPGKRQKEHTSDYGQEFEIVKRFAVPDTKALERVALQLTVQYHYSEANRNELRKMGDSEIQDFLEKFGEICKTVIDK